MDDAIETAEAVDAEVTDMGADPGPAAPALPEPAASRRHPAIRGTPVRMGGREWLLANEPKNLGDIWDRLYDQNVLGTTYDPFDVMGAAARLLWANYDLDPDTISALLLTAEPQALVPAVERALMGPDDGHRTYTRWVTASLIANGIDPADVPPDRLHDVLETLVATGRAVPAAAFISSMAAVAERSRIAATFD